MKNLKLLFPCLFLLSFFGNLSAQANLERQHCNTLIASLTKKSLANKHLNEVNDGYSFALEKQMIPGVWNKGITKTSQAKSVVFANLPEGIYRVSIVPIKERLLQRTNVHYRGKIDVSEAHDIFVSNPIEISRTTAECKISKTFEAPVVNVKQSLKGLRLYPNPAQTILNVFYPEQGDQASLIIYTLTGQELKSYPITPLDNSLSIEDLIPGIYIAKVVRAGEILLSKKLLVIR